MFQILKEPVIEPSTQEPYEVPSTHYCITIYTIHLYQCLPQGRAFEESNMSSHRSVVGTQI